MAYRSFLWRHENREERSRQRKRERVRKKLRQLGHLPEYKSPLTEQQEKIWNEISNNDFSFWDTIKSKNGHSGGVGINWTKPIIVSDEKRIWMRAKQNAKEGGYDFDLEIDDIVIPELCPYLQVPLLTDYEQRLSPFYYSIDRIDSKKGYVKGNVQIISRLSNTMKSNATLEQLKIFAESIIRRH
jgi:hypothetical protein